MNRSSIKQGTRLIAGAIAANGLFGIKDFRNSQCESLTTAGDSSPEWAYPHPYDNSVEKSRFLDSSGTKYRESVDQWKLNELVKLWEESDGEETWPWVWCLRNPVGPHHVFIGVSKQTLELASKVCDEDRNNNLTIIVKSLADIEAFAPVSEFYKCRCGVIECPVQQTDVENKMIMLQDERIICFDHAYVS